MTNVSNPFAPACRQLLPKYTISTLRATDIVDNQDSYGCILKFTRFRNVKKERRVNAFHYVCRPTHFARDRASAYRSAIAKLIIIFDSSSILGK